MCGCSGVSSDGSYAFTGSSNGEIFAWDIREGRLARILRAATKSGSPYLTAMAVSGDGDSLLLGFSDGVLAVIDSSTGAVRAELNDHKRVSGAGSNPYITSIAASPEGRYAFSSAVNAIVKWDLRKVQAVLTLDWAKEPISSLSVSPDVKYVIACDRKGEVQVWEPKKGLLLPVKLNWSDNERARQVWLSSSEKEMVVVSRWTPRIAFFDLEKGTQSRTIDVRSGGIPWAQFYSLSPDARSIAVLGAGRIALFDLETGNKSWDAPLPRGSYTGWWNRITFTADGKQILFSSGQPAGAKNSVLWLLDAGSGAQLRECSLNTVAFQSAALSAAGNAMVVCLPGGEVQVRDLESLTVTRRYQAGRTILACEISDEGRYVLVASKQNDSRTRGTNIVLWDNNTGEVVWRDRRKDIAIQSMKLSPPGRYIALSLYGNASRFVKVYAVSPFPKTVLFQDCSGDRYHSGLAFSPDESSLLMTASSGKEGLLFELPEAAQLGRVVTRLEGSWRPFSQRTEGYCPLPATTSWP